MKILIIGTIGSGKTSLAKKLANDLNMTHYEIDSIVHDDFNNKKRTSEQQKEIIEEINKQENWIIEGVLRQNLYNLLDMADQIIYLDIPLNIRKIRIFKRFIKQKLGIEKSNYKPTLNMLKQMYKWVNKQECEKEERESQINKYYNKLIKVKNVNKVYREEFVKNEHSKTKKIK